MQKEILAPGIARLEIEGPRIARKHKAGQFVIVRVYQEGERIPLTIEKSDPHNGTISLVVQAVGKTTHLLNSLKVNEFVLDIVGPLGQPSEIGRFGTVVIIGGGVGTAMAYPTAAALKKAGNRLISIIGARDKHRVILEKEIGEFSDELLVTTEDGSAGTKGLATDSLQKLISNRNRVDRVIAVGPIPMMKAVADITRANNIRTIVSLNPIMLDGTGMCGGCRVLVDGHSRLACVDGPEFDAHRVDFETLLHRNEMYRDAERESMSQCLKENAVRAERN